MTGKAMEDLTEKYTIFMKIKNSRKQQEYVCIPVAGKGKLNGKGTTTTVR